MDVPNVIGDWQEYQSDELSGLRVRVHDLKKAKPSRGRDDDAKGLTYVSFQVTFENRGSEYYGIDFRDHPKHVDVRVGRDGHEAFVDIYGSSRIREFNLYPHRRVTAVIYAAATPAKLKQIDIQICPEIDDDTIFGYHWVGGLGVHEGSTRTSRRASTAEPSVANEVEQFLKGATSEGT
ncbi:hypothetical protein KBZ00_32300 [Streptomyces sp. RK31]|uniref:hypothetical protein n=1 Tax=Streptomyces TaxID=1883 RepID=UPI001B393A71|nr:hypothetical protein [Streptomyces sp. RK31]MBQ0975752.1 hypothetical protein [Streptomyces sp. RK31]